MAADYVEHIRSVQETGPYHLLGWSLGGIVAHEMAVQLQSAGEQVAALVSMDGIPPRLNVPSQDDQSDEDRQPPPIQEDDVLAELRQQYSGNESIASEADFANAVRIIRNNSGLAHSHEFRRFDGNLLLIISSPGATDAANTNTDPADPEVDPAEAWIPYVSGNIAKHSLPCTHQDMARPDMLGQVWQAISEWLSLAGE
jgi:thioesterase domain-containing protein